MKNKILLFIAIVATLMCLFAISSSAADVVVDGILYSTNTSNGKASVKGLSDTTITNLVIPDTITDGGKEYRVTSINKNAFANNTTITNAVIGDNVATFNEGCFKSCTALVNVEMPAAFNYLGSAAFQSCTNLETIDFSKVKHGNDIDFYNYGHFSGCSKLVAISIPEGVKYLKQQSFANCTDLTAVYLPSTLTHITGNNTNWDHSCFKNCSKMYFVQDPFDIDDCFVNGEFKAPAKPSVYYFPSGFVGFAKTSPTSETSSTTTAAFIKCHSLNDTIVFPATCTDFTNHNVFAQTLRDAPSGKTVNIVFLGDITTFNYSERLNGLRLYFVNANDVGITSFTTTSANTNNNSDAYIYFCNKTYYKLSDLTTALTSETDIHLLSDKMTEKSPATCVDFAVYNTQCFCGNPLGEVDGTELDPDNHDMENATLVSIVYPKYTENGTKTVACGYGCGEHLDSDVKALFVTKGYSIKSDGYGITTDYEVNSEALNAYMTYLEANGKAFEFGIFIGNSETFGETFIKADGTVDNSYAFSQKVNADGFTKVKCTVADFTEEEATLTLVMGLYVIDDGKVSYIQHKGQSEYAGTVKKGETTLDVVTIVKIAELEKVELPFAVPANIPTGNEENN